MKALLVCAGYSTRLPETITNGMPKHFISIGDKKLMDLTLEQVDSLDEIDEVFLITNNLFFNVFQDYLNSRNFKKKIELMNDGTNNPDERLGTVGDILKIIEDKQVDDNVIILFPDNLHNFDLKKTLNYFFSLNNPLLVCYDVGTKEIAKTVGVVQHDNNLITELIEKPEEPKSTLTSIGIYLFPKRVISRFKEYKEEGNNLDRMGDFNSWIVQKEKVFAYIYGENYKWFDIGTEETYKKAMEEWTT